MLKYAGMAAASKIFSVNAATRRLYRRMGNVALERMRVAEGLPTRYVDRADRLLKTCDRFEILRPGDSVLELGTGWVHWEATVLSLFHDVRVTLFDVCDNRLLKAYQAYLAQFREQLGDGMLTVSDERRERALDRLHDVATFSTFEEIYDRLGFEYVINPEGSLADLAEEKFALVVSSDVLEHVPASILPVYLGEAHDRLRPGGYSVHQIDLVDHFQYFDTGVSPKNYYRYDDKSWQRWFESDVQYFNRIQRPEWRWLFTEAGFDLVEEDEIAGPVDEITLARRFQQLSPEDRACMQMLVVHRRKH